MALVSLLKVGGRIHTIVRTFPPAAGAAMLEAALQPEFSFNLAQLLQPSHQKYVPA
jgi:hypothetical protein